MSVFSVEFARRSRTNSIRHNDVSLSPKQQREFSIDDDAPFVDTIEAKKERKICNARVRVEKYISPGWAVFKKNRDNVVNRMKGSCLSLQSWGIGARGPHAIARL